MVQADCSNVIYTISKYTLLSVRQTDPSKCKNLPDSINPHPTYSTIPLLRMDSDQNCARNVDGLLKEANEIKWFDSPSDERPLTLPSEAESPTPAIISKTGDEHCSCVSSLAT